MPLKYPELSRKRGSTQLWVLAVLLAGSGFLGSARGEKVLVYDEEQGIIFVEKSELINGKAPPRKTTTTTLVETVTVKKTLPSASGGIKTTRGRDLHVGREKDPPEVYFDSGLEYFKNRDFEDALNNFEAAFKRKKSPEFLLWIGKCHRQLGNGSKHGQTMERILKEFPTSAVADDALFEIAFSNQAQNRYEVASGYYARLAEQYPFGTSYSNGEEFREIARAQRRAMRSEMIAALKMLSYTGEDLKDLYSQFQKSSGLHPTGLGDSATVRLVKEKYHSFLAQQETQKVHHSVLGTRVRWGYLAAVILLGLCTALAVQLAAIRRAHKTLESYEQTLSELRL